MVGTPVAPGAGFVIVQGSPISIVGQVGACEGTAVGEGAGVGFGVAEGTGDGVATGALDGTGDSVGGAGGNC